MTAASGIAAGQRILAAEIQGVAPLAAYKAANQSVASSATFVDDDALLLTLVADAVYHFKCVIGYNGASSGSGDIDFAWSLPSGASMTYALQGYKGGVAAAGFWETAASISMNTNGTGTTLSAVMEGTIVMSSTPGVAQLQWKQNTTNSGTPTTVVTGSDFLAWQIQ